MADWKSLAVGPAFASINQMRLFHRGGAQLSNKHLISAFTLIRVGSNGMYITNIPMLCCNNKSFYFRLASIYPPSIHPRAGRSFLRAKVNCKMMKQHFILCKKNEVGEGAVRCVRPRRHLSLSTLICQ